MTPADLLTRFLFGGAAVVVSAVVARMAGGRIGGIFAAFPAVYISAVIATAWESPAAGAANQVLALSRGALIGMTADIACAICAGMFIRRLGLYRGLGFALLVWLVLSSGTFFGALALGWLA